MNIEKLNHWLTLVANVGVLAGIVFLAVELQQSNRIATASTEIDIRSNYGPLAQAIFENADFAELMVKAESPEGGLDKVEQLRLGYWVNQLANQWLAMEIAYENGMIPRETYDVIFDDQRRFVETYPALGPLLRNLFDFYPALSNSAVSVSMENILRSHGY